VLCAVVAISVVLASLAFRRAGILRVRASDARTCTHALAHAVCVADPYGRARTSARTCWRMLLHAVADPARRCAAAPRLCVCRCGPSPWSASTPRSLFASCPSRRSQARGSRCGWACSQPAAPPSSCG
jgi:hypothetical protein